MLRRDCGKLVGLLAVSQEMAFAQASRVDAPAGAVMINANENPMGPCKEALDALHSIAGQGGRYLFSEGEKVQQLLADQEGLEDRDRLAAQSGFTDHGRRFPDHRLGRVGTRLLPEVPKPPPRIHRGVLECGQLEGGRGSV